jgi:sulfite exporter TauE/SafE
VFAITSWLLALALLVAAHRLWDRSGSRVVRTIGIRSRFDRWTSALARNLPTEPAAYGVITALLPCGALYAALLVAASAASPAGGALSMIVFALTSSVGLLAFGWFARRSSRASAGSWRRALAVALLVGAVLLAIRPIGALTADEPSHACCHG